MRHIVATLIVIGLLVAAANAVDVHGQDACSFVGGFARLRELVGADKIGNCLEDEHFNVENGNAEQRTTGGLLVWRKADNFTAFTDGGTTWVNGPEGLQKRPNNERFAWETDPVTAPSTTVASTGPVASSPPAPTPTATSAVARSASPAPAAASAGTIAGGTTATTGAVAAATTPTTAATPTSAATPTKTATPTPAVTAKFTEKPDNAETGSDVRWEVSTNADDKGTCTLTVAFKGQAEVGVGQQTVDDGKCEFPYNIPSTAKTGQAKAKLTVSSQLGTTTVEDDFEVKKGDMYLSGDMDIEIEGEDLPDDVGVGQEVKISVKTNIKSKGTCDLSITWPKNAVPASVAGEQQTPNGDGKCSWRLTAPTEIPKKGTATLSVIVKKKKNDSVYRQLTAEFEVKK